MSLTQRRSVNGSHEGIATTRAAIRIDGWTCTTLLPHERPSKLNQKLDGPVGPRRQSFALGRARGRRAPLC